VAAKKMHAEVQEQMRRQAASSTSGATSIAPGTAIEETAALKEKTHA
jgi:hypothetical protein